MVIACNTASVVALAELRRRYEIPFVGVVPAVKPAAAMTRRNSIGILATRRTVEDPYTERLIRTYAADCRVSLFPGVEIVDFVENRFSSATEAERKGVLRPAVDYFRDREVDTLAVACTHFIFVQQELAEMMGHGTRVIDSREGVGRQVLRLLGRNEHAGGDSSPDSGGGTGIFFVSSGENHDQYQQFAETFGLEWGGRL